MLFGLTIIYYRQFQKLIYTPSLTAWAVQNTLCMSKDGFPTDLGSCHFINAMGLQF